MESKVGIILIATRKYDVFLQPLIDSAEKHFFKYEPYDVYLFTDKPQATIKAERATIYVREIPPYTFPFATLFRYKTMVKNRDIFKARNLYYLDVDMLFVGDVGEEIMGNALVATQHPGYYNGGWGSRKTHSASCAYLKPELWHDYYCGGFQGGKKDKYLAMAELLDFAIDTDLDTAREMGYTKNNGILAEWHDESFYNFYIKVHGSHGLKVLSPSYCYPESWNLPFEKKILALDKNHKEIRS